MDFKKDDFNSTNLEMLIEHPVGTYSKYKGRCKYADWQAGDDTRPVKDADKADP